ncbi:hypothetical protein B9Z55_004092 [Caenorhabditis nigoni]|uniref:Uncharacterized protein n=1 Tax=Caenorhabditis nigoni TaxID=1611254 RepID=A0A2G5UUV8_9PELO|nr:hypothetical protein B9Z55_004092 [Caenorhabditis nigoni]
MPSQLTISEVDRLKLKVMRSLLNNNVQSRNPSIRPAHILEIAPYKITMKFPASEFFSKEGVFSKMDLNKVGEAVSRACWEVTLDKPDNQAVQTRSNNNDYHLPKPEEEVVFVAHAREFLPGGHTLNYVATVMRGDKKVKIAMGNSIIKVVPPSPPRTKEEKMRAAARLAAFEKAHALKNAPVAPVAPVLPDAPVALVAPVISDAPVAPDASVDPAPRPEQQQQPGPSEVARRWTKTEITRDRKKRREAGQASSMVPVATASPPPAATKVVSTCPAGVKHSNPAAPPPTTSGAHKNLASVPPRPPATKTMSTRPSQATNPNPIVAPPPTSEVHRNLASVPPPPPTTKMLNTRPVGAPALVNAPVAKDVPMAPDVSVAPAPRSEQQRESGPSEVAAPRGWTTTEIGQDRKRRRDERWAREQAEAGQTSSAVPVVTAPPPSATTKHSNAAAPPPTTSGVLRSLASVPPPPPAATKTMSTRPSQATNSNPAAAPPTTSGVHRSQASAQPPPTSTVQPSAPATNSTRAAPRTTPAAPRPSQPVSRIPSILDRRYHRSLESSVLRQYDETKMIFMNEIPQRFMLCGVKDIHDLATQMLAKKFVPVNIAQSALFFKTPLTVFYFDVECEWDQQQVKKAMFDDAKWSEVFHKDNISQGKFFFARAMPLKTILRTTLIATRIFDHRVGGAQRSETVEDNRELRLAVQYYEGLKIRKNLDPMGLMILQGLCESIGFF